MNYPTFLSEVDRMSAALDAEALRAFVHELARTFPETERLRFLEVLKSASACPEEKMENKTEENGELCNQVDQVIETLEEIQEERALESEYNEEWDEWQGEGDEFIFSDPDGILDDIEEAIRVMHQCLDQELFDKGAELAQALSELFVLVTGDYEDTMTLPELVANDLLKINLKKTVKEAVYLTCMGTPPAERAEAMLAVLQNFREDSISLDEILQTVTKKIDLSSFLPSCIEVLAKRPGNAAGTLLLEAQEMLQDKEAALNMASRYAGSQPILYKRLLEKGMEKTDSKEMLQIGLRGMKEVPERHPVRVEIALLTAEIALKAQDREAAEQCWMEAYLASPTVENYLRLRLGVQSFNREQARAIYTAYYEKLDKLERKPLAALFYFDERFEEMIRDFMNAGNGIGWSSTFMKQGIALLLLLMDAGTTKGAGIFAMQVIVVSACPFDAATYCRGTDLDPGTPTRALFENCFRKWKSGITLPEEQFDAWLEKIGQWLKLRVSAIMEANRRYYYRECAAFIAAYGEVLESRGQPGEKKKVMLWYKEKYSHRRAFHNELSGFGLR